MLILESKKFWYPYIGSSRQADTYQICTCLYIYYIRAFRVHLTNTEGITILKENSNTLRHRRISQTKCYTHLGIGWRHINTMTPRGNPTPNVVKQSNCETEGLKSKHWIWQLYSAILTVMHSTIKIGQNMMKYIERNTNCQTQYIEQNYTLNKCHPYRENKTKRHFSCHNCFVLLSRDCKMTWHFIIGML